MKKKQVTHEALRALSQWIASMDDNEISRPFFDYMWDLHKRRPTDRELKWFSDEINDWYWKIRDKRDRLKK